MRSPRRARRLPGAGWLVGAGVAVEPDGVVSVESIAECADAFGEVDGLFGGGLGDVVGGECDGDPLHAVAECDVDAAFGGGGFADAFSVDDAGFSVVGGESHLGERSVCECFGVCFGECFFESDAASFEEGVGVEDGGDGAGGTCRGLHTFFSLLKLI